PAAARGSAPEGKPRRPPCVPLAGPPFRLLAQVVKAGDGGQEEQLVNEKEGTIPISVFAPHEQVEAPQTQFDDKTNTLYVTVRARDNFAGLTPCPVELDLSPEHIPGLIPGRKEGAYGQKLSRAKQDVELAARNLRFKDDNKGPAEGRFALTVDGCPRALIYKT